MVKKIIKTNPNLIELINKLNKQSKSEDAAISKLILTLLNLLINLINNQKVKMQLFGKMLLIDFQGQIEELQK